MKNPLFMRALCAALLWMGSVFGTQASITCLINTPEAAFSPRSALSVQVVFMNTGSKPERFELPGRMSAYLEDAKGMRTETLMESNLPEKWVEIAPGSFVTRQYQIPAAQISALELPASSALKISLENSSSISIDRLPDGDSPETETLPEVEADTETSGFITGDLGKEGMPVEEDSRRQHSAMVDYFFKHFYPYEPIYFLIGGNPSGGAPDLRGDFPNARFQISLRYAPFIEDSWIADQWSGFTNVFVTYTQNTVWDLEGESAPFLDSMFKPELQYYWRDIFKEEKGILRKMDILAAIAHESNGRNGAASRSINYALVRPALYFGNPERFNGYLAPGFWFYFGALTDNPEIRHYRGHADVKAAVQWADTLQLAGTFRMGDELEKGSMQLDLTYPLGQLTANTLDLYLHLQYFTGYGQTLLNYDRREQALRAGVSFLRQ
ncbi:MAG TPA: phospholipase A [Verrucomicrobiota bacterium]|nr:phospholipase A [Verrucomicrobiota bacterium]